MHRNVKQSCESKVCTANGPDVLPETPNNVAQNFQNQYYNRACNSGSPMGPFLSMIRN